MNGGTNNIINADALALRSSRNSAKLENTLLSADGLQESVYGYVKVCIL